MGVIDFHSDLPMNIQKMRNLGVRNILDTYYYDDMCEGNVQALVAAVFLEEQQLSDAFKSGLSQLKALIDDVNECSNHFVICKTYQDYKNGIKEGKIGIFIAFEGVEPVGRDIGLLDTFYDMGLRIISLTWGRRNYAADGCEFGIEDTWSKGGMTPFGRKIIEYIEARDLILDVSHLSEKAFWEIRGASNIPLIASHSNAAGVHNIRRNLTDQQIIAIAESKGLIAINGVNAIINDLTKEVSIDDYIDHIDYIKKLIGIEYIAIGLDLFKYHAEKIYSEEMVKVFCGPAYDVINNYAYLNILRERMINRGYTDGDIEKIFITNSEKILMRIK